jgi:hypothetical protein
MADFVRKAFQADAPALFERARVSGLRIDGRTSRWDRLAASPVLAAVRELRLNRAGMSATDFAVLLASPHVAHLHTLHLGHNHLGYSGFALLGQATTLPRLRRLHLPSCQYLTGEHLAALLAWPQAARLTTLDLAETWIQAGQVAQLADSPRLAGLTRLDLSYNHLQAAGAVALASSPTSSARLRSPLRFWRFRCPMRPTPLLSSAHERRSLAASHGGGHRGRRPCA